VGDKLMLVTQSCVVVAVAQIKPCCCRTDRLPHVRGIPPHVWILALKSDLNRIYLTSYKGESSVPVAYAFGTQNTC